MGLITTHKAYTALTTKVEEAGYAALSKEERAACCAVQLTDEVRNGGLYQYFGNSSGEHSSDAVASLVEIGASEMILDAVKAVLAHFEGGIASADTEVRRAQLEKLEPRLFEPSDRVLHREWGPLITRVHRYIWERFPDHRAVAAQSASPQLTALFHRFEDRLSSSGEVVDVGRFGRFTPNDLRFCPSDALRDLIGDGKALTLTASDLSTLGSDLHDEAKALDELCHRLERDEGDAVTVGPFYFGLLRHPPYASRNPRTGTTIMVPGKRGITGGLLGDDGHP